MKRLNIKVLLLIFFTIIGVVFLLISNKFLKQLANEEQQNIKLWAMAVEQMANTKNLDQDLSFILNVIQNNRTIPVILVDTNMMLINYMNIDKEELQDSLSISHTINRIARVHDPIDILVDGVVINRVYYDDSSTLKRLVLYPYLFIAIIALFLFISYIVVIQSLRSEQNSIWVGMAKETAHQLGTPTSSLMACVALLQDSSLEPTILEELQKDVNRLNRVAMRFSKIGSSPDIKLVDLAEVIHNSVDYLSSRLSTHVKIDVDIPSPVNMTTKGNFTLLEWVLENLIKNAVDAMQGSGHISIRLFEEMPWLILDVTDDGKGISHSDVRKIFRAGFTTKSRGWGLGLTLAKRIITHYHRGKIFVQWSEQGKGTTFRIMLKAHRQ